MDIVIIRIIFIIVKDLNPYLKTFLIHAKKIPLWMSLPADSTSY